jgi:hypothetical protein
MVDMTREEFNKLSQQERLNLVGKKWFGLYKNDKEYGWYIERTYAKGKSGRKQLWSERSWVNIQLPFEKYFDGLEVWLATDKGGNYHICYKNGGLTFSIGTIPDGFLEETYFFELPKSTINERINEDSLDIFQPFEEVKTDYRSVEEICRKRSVLHDDDNKTKRSTSWFDNPQTLTKINIAIISVAVLITVINILCVIC